jgi:protein-S-isoprenylcysteine O-methyltransferase Ste14
MVVIAGVAAAVVLLSAVAARTAERPFKGTLIAVTVAFVVFTPALFFAGSYDCGDEGCSSLQLVIPWTWIILGACSVGLALTVLVATAIKALRRRSSSDH